MASSKGAHNSTAGSSIDICPLKISSDHRGSQKWQTRCPQWTEAQWLPLTFVLLSQNRQVHTAKLASVDLSIHTANTTGGHLLPQSTLLRSTGRLLLLLLLLLSGAPMYALPAIVHTRATNTCSETIREPHGLPLVSIGNKWNHCPPADVNKPLQAFREILAIQVGHTN